MHRDLLPMNSGNESGATVMNSERPIRFSFFSNVVAVETGGISSSDYQFQRGPVILSNVIVLRE